MNIEWEEGFEISVRTDGTATLISADEKGLRSLAAQLYALADQPAGSHIHYDSYNSLEENSSELIIEKRE